MSITATTDPPNSPAAEPAGRRIEAIVLLVAVTCFAGIIWGVADANWVMVAAEIPAVLALLAIWFYMRARAGDHRAAMAAAAIGLACAVEIWIATAVFDARGMQLAVIVAASSAATIAVAVVYFLVRSNYSQTGA